MHNLAQTDKEYWDIPRHETLFGFSTNINEPSKLEGHWLALSSSAQAYFNAVECLSTPCRFCPRLRTSEYSKSGLGGGLDSITCAHNFYVKIFSLAHHLSSYYSQQRWNIIQFLSVKVFFSFPSLELWYHLCPSANSTVLLPRSYWGYEFRPYFHLHWKLEW